MRIIRHDMADMNDSADSLSPEFHRTPSSSSAAVVAVICALIINVGSVGYHGLMLLIRDNCLGYMDFAPVFLIMIAIPAAIASIVTAIAWWLLRSNQAVNAVVGIFSTLLVFAGVLGIILIESGDSSRCFFLR